MKTLLDIRDTFNMMYNNVNSGAAPGLNDYEISQYLTMAQRKIVDEYYSGNNVRGLSFEATESLRKRLSGLVSGVEYMIDGSTPTRKIAGILDSQYVCYMMPRPENFYRTLTEEVRLTWDADDVHAGGERTIEVEVMAFDSLSRVMDNPFRRPSSRRILRVDYEGREVLVISRKILRHPGTRYEYDLVYLHVPYPIILVDLTDFAQSSGLGDYPLTINGETAPADFPSSYDDFMIDIIIDRAVALATMDYKENTLSNRLAISTRAE
jgi:hypothetical protein